MLIRLGFLVAASIAAFTVKQITIKYSKPSSSFVKPSDILDEIFKHCNGEEREKYILQDSKYSLEKETMEDVPNTLRNHYQLTNCMQKMPSEERSELECLRSLVNGMEETQENLSTNLLVCYGLKEQEMEIVELRDHLKEKRIEINKLSFTENYLKGVNKKLQEDITQSVVIKKQLEKARIKIRDLEQKIGMNANQRNGILLMLKDQVESILTDPNPDSDAEIQKKLKAGTDLQLEAMELKRRHKELQLEKRILAIKVVVVEARIASFFNTTESEVVRRIRIEGDASRLTNENLLKQVETLQKDRFNVVEELVYQRWVNACLRYEIQNHQMPFRKNSTCQVKPVSYPCSSTESNDFYNQIEVRSRSDKRRSLIHKLKRWRRNLDNFSVASSLSKSFGSSSRETPSSESTRSRRSSFSVGSFGRSTLRNIRNRVSFTAVRDKSARGSPETESIPIRRRRVSFNDSLNTSVTSSERTSSLVGILDDKYPTDMDCEKIVFDIEKPVEGSGSDLLSIPKTEIEETIKGVSDITDAAAPRMLRTDDTNFNNVQPDLGLLCFDATFVAVVVVVVLLYILYLHVSIF